MIQEPIAVLPVIPAERFVLRPLRRSDAGLISLYAADVRVARGTRSIPHPLPSGTTEGFIARAMSDRRDSDIWALDGSAQDLDEVLGIVTLTPVRDDQSEVSYWVAPAFWNTGFASEAVMALVAANPHRSRSLVAEVFQDNAASARVLTNAGFAYLGDAETWSVARGAKVATWTYLRKMA
jgi:RimJ/RimL family protein N-acetyltransferase